MVELHPYQVQGIDYLIKHRRVVLADEMGLGKTCQAIRACDQCGANLILVVCPVTLIGTWQTEIRKWATREGVSVVAFEGSLTARTELLKQAKHNPPCWVLVGYDYARIHIAELGKISWDTIILDEAHKLKNRKSLTYRRFATSLKSHQLYCLTGTPVINHAKDLWTLLHLIDKKRWRGFWTFAHTYCKVFFNGWAMEVGETIVPEQLVKDITGHYLRRLKTDVRLQLPEKTHVQITVELSKSQRKLYTRMKKFYVAELENELILAPHILTKLLRLKEICIDPSLMSDVLNEGPLEGAKIDACLDILGSLGTQKAVVATQFARVVARMRATLAKAYPDMVVCTLEGSMSRVEREKSLETFHNAPPGAVLCMTTQTGGVGLTLTDASVMVLMDLMWSPAHMLQAEDRLHRIGQVLPVTIYSIMAANSIEVQIQQLLELKHGRVLELDDLRTLLMT